MSNDELHFAWSLKVGLMWMHDVRNPVWNEVFGDEGGCVAGSGGGGRDVKQFPFSMNDIISLQVERRLGGSEGKYFPSSPHMRWACFWFSAMKLLLTTVTLFSFLIFRPYSDGLSCESAYSLSRPLIRWARFRFSEVKLLLAIITCFSFQAYSRFGYLRQITMCCGRYCQRRFEEWNTICSN